MLTKLFSAALALGGLVWGQAAAPDTAVAQTANREIMNMLQANVPESTIVSEIEILAERGSTFDISPAAIVAMQRQGATERVLNTVVWAQMTIVPGVSIPTPRGVFYRKGSTATELRSFELWPELGPRWSTWPFYTPEGKTVALAADAYIVQVTESTPTLYVQGLAASAGWQLVKIGRAADHREVPLKVKHAFSRDFFSDAMFQRDELRPVTLATDGAGATTVRPASPLQPGAYALCGGAPTNGWLRTCYEFQITGM